MFDGEGKKRRKGYEVLFDYANSLSGKAIAVIPGGGSVRRTSDVYSTVLEQCCKEGLR